MQTISIKKIIGMIIILAISIYFLTGPFNGMTTINGQEVIAVIEEQLDKDNKVFIDNIEIKEVPNIYMGVDMTLKSKKTRKEMKYINSLLLIPQEQVM